MGIGRAYGRGRDKTRRGRRGGNDNFGTGTGGTTKRPPVDKEKQRCVSTRIRLSLDARTHLTKQKSDQSERVNVREITELFLGFFLGESIGDMIACSLVVAAKSVARVTLDLHMKIMGRGNGHDVRKIIRILGTGASVEDGTFFMIAGK